MIQYTNYCTDEQTRRAYKLSAPLEIFNPDNSNGVLIDDKAFAIPTTQQMLGWLRDKGISITITYEMGGYGYSVRLMQDVPDDVISEDYMYSYQDYNKAELAAIDAALDYLEKR